jgi:hypothetical protein
MYLTSNASSGRTSLLVLKRVEMTKLPRLPTALQSASSVYARASSIHHHSYLSCQGRLNSKLCKAGYTGDLYSQDSGQLPPSTRSVTLTAISSFWIGQSWWFGTYPRPVTGSQPLVAKKPVELQPGLLPTVISVKTSGCAYYGVVNRQHETSQRMPWSKQN